MSSDPERLKRRKVLLDPGLQLGLTVRLVALLYVYFLGCAVACNVPAILRIALGDGSAAAQTAAADELRAFASSTVLPLALTFVALAIHGVFLTHRVAGPVYRMKRFLAEIAARRLPPPIRLRKKDALKDLADDLNAAVAVLREDAARRRVLVDSVLQASHRLARSLEAPDADPREALAQAHAVLDTVEVLSAHVDGSVSSAPAPAVPLLDPEQPADAEPAVAAA